MIEPDKFIMTNADPSSMPPPLTIDSLKQACEAILKDYSGAMRIEPDWFTHFTPCCERAYSTMGMFSDHCPYNCGKPWTPGYCTSCREIEAMLKESA